METGLQLACGSIVQLGIVQLTNDFTMVPDFQNAGVIGVTENRELGLESIGESLKLGQ